MGETGVDVDLPTVKIKNLALLKFIYFGEKL